MRSGASGQIDEVETNLEKLSRDFAPNSERDNRVHRFDYLEASGLVVFHALIHDLVWI